MAISFSPPALFPFSPPRTLNPYANPIVSTNSLHHGLRIALRTQRTLRSSLCISCLRYSRAAVVTGKSWDKLILESSSPTLVEFYASWCGPCRMVHRVIDEIAAEYSGKLKCFVIYVDKDRKVVQNYDVKSVPVVLLFKNGEVVESMTGTMPKEFYVAAIERVLAS